MYDSLAAVVKESKKSGTKFWQVIQEDDCREEAIDRQKSFGRMRAMYEAMRDSVNNYDPTLHSASGLVGTDAAKLEKYYNEGKMMADDFVGRVMIRALRVAESNACMKRIVAAPTAGSCGVLPSVLITMQEERKLSDEQMIEALYVAAGIGGVISKRASLSGADGGCQAEIGSASAMAAGALVGLMGGTAEQITNAAAIALKSLLGLACDPVAGLVEVPCVKRNVIGSVNAVTAADMAMAGIKSRIPPDEVIDAMRSIGHGMSTSIRETGTGGLAATPTGVKIREKVTKW
jgi:L-serine dehydratase